MVNQSLSVALLRTKVALSGHLAARSILEFGLTLNVLSQCAGARQQSPRSSALGGIDGGWRWDAARRRYYSTDAAAVSCGA